MFQVTLREDYEIAAEDRSWDGNAARQRIAEWADGDRAKESTCYLAYDEETGEGKLPVCDIIDDEPAIIPRAVSAAAASLSGARGGVDLPDEIIAQCKEVIERIYERMGRPAPWVKLLKMAGERMRGYGVVFNSVDLDGEVFTKDTDFWLDRLRLESYPVLYDHGQHDWVKHAVVGTARAHVDDAGIWLDIELERAEEYREYVAMIRGLAARGVLGVSSGAVAHLVRREGRKIVEWPVVEFSLTPTPAEPRTIGVELISEFAPQFKSKFPPAEAAREADTVSSDAPASEVGAEAEAGASLNNLKSNQEQEMETKAMYVTESAPARLGDFLKAVQVNDLQRIEALGATKDVAGGGYLIPAGFVDQIMQVNETSLGEILARTFVVRNPRSNVVNIPVLNQTGANGYYGGVSVSIVGEGVAKPEVQPTFEQLSLTLYKLAAHTQASDELISDTPIALEQYLVPLFRNALLAAAEQYIMNGTGSGQPMGILATGNAARIDITRTTANEVKINDIARMYAAQANPSNAVWIAHPQVIAQLMQISSGNTVAWMPNVAAPVPATVMGRPLIVSRFAAPLGSTGDISFVDLSQYYVAMTDPVVDVSRDYAFVNDLTTWRFVLRIGARPNLYSKVTIATGVDVSPFVSLSATASS